MIKYKHKALVIGLKGYTLTSKEKTFLKNSKPWGVILFSRNIINLNQLKKLTTQIKKIVNNKNYPIFIDEEGGDVSRLNKIINHNYFSAKFFGDLYIKDKIKFEYTYKSYINFLSNIFHYTVININTVPVLDLRVKGSSNIIGDRSFSSNKVSALEIVLLVSSLINFASLLSNKPNII